MGLVWMDSRRCEGFSCWEQEKVLVTVLEGSSRCEVDCGSFNFVQIMAVNVKVLLEVAVYI